MQLGDFHIRPQTLIYIGVIIVSAFLTVRLMHYFLNRYINRSSLILKVDRTRFNFLKNALSFIIYSAAVFAIIYVIPELRALSLTLFAGAGVVAAIIGFASQAAFSNIISGTFIVIFKPFRVGDLIRVGSLYIGTVEDITMRHTVIRDFENQRIIIPNSVISAETVINTDIVDQAMRKHVHFGISYDSDLDNAIAIIRQEAENHPLIWDRRTPEQIAENEPLIEIRVTEWQDSGIKVRAYCPTRNFDDAWVLSTDLLYSVKKRFDKEGIEIPYPHRTIVYKDDKKAKRTD